MKKTFKIIITLVSAFFLVNAMLNTTPVLAWGDSDGGRQEYTIEEIEQGALGPVGGDAKEQPDYPGKIVFNSISDSVMGHEFNYVGARETVLQENGTWESPDSTWEGNDLTVEDGKIYIIRMYIHNNNPHGWDAVAEDTYVAFNIPSISAKTVHVNGYIRSSNAAPTEYVDYVNFNSDTPFHLEYIPGTALLENNGIGLGGLTLSDDIVQAKDGGILIGYDALDGRIPGCFQYDGVVTIKVKVIYDYSFTIETKARLADVENSPWQKAVEAKVGDIIEFQIEYNNTDDDWQCGVAIKDILPQSLRYVEGSTVLYNASHPSGLVMHDNSLVTTGFGVGNYGIDSNAIVRFKAEVIAEGLECGSNTLVNWGQAGVSSTTLQDYTQVLVQRNSEFIIISTILLILILVCLVIIILLLPRVYRRYWFR